MGNLVEMNLKSSNGVSCNCGVGTSHVRRRIDVVERCGEDERVGICGALGIVRTSSVMAAAARGGEG